MARRLFVCIVALVVVLASAGSVYAQDYFFAVERETVDVYWNADGTSSLEYTFHFVNQPGAADIEFVDVGMPTNSFDMSSVSAEVDGTRVSVSRDEYEGDGSGFAVVLGHLAVRPGQRGAVHVTVGRITGVVHPDTSDDSYASVVFVPTFFGSRFVTGSTDLTVTFHLPPGVQPEEPRFHPARTGPAPRSRRPASTAKIESPTHGPIRLPARPINTPLAPRSQVVHSGGFHRDRPSIDLGKVIGSAMGLIVPSGASAYSFSYLSESRFSVSSKGRDANFSTCLQDIHRRSWNKARPHGR